MPHVCDFCGKAFRIQHALTVHVKLHLGTARYRYRYLFHADYFDSHICDLIFFKHSLCRILNADKYAKIEPVCGRYLGIKDKFTFRNVSYSTVLIKFLVYFKKTDTKGCNFTTEKALSAHVQNVQKGRYLP